MAISVASSLLPASLYTQAFLQVCLHNKPLTSPVFLIWQDWPWPMLSVYSMLRAYRDLKLKSSQKYHKCPTFEHIYITPRGEKKHSESLPLYFQPVFPWIFFVPFNLYSCPPHSTLRPHGHQSKGSSIFVCYLPQLPLLYAKKATSVVLCFYSRADLTMR